MALFRVLLELRRVWDSRVGVRVRASWRTPKFRVSVVGSGFCRSRFRVLSLGDVGGFGAWAFGFEIWGFWSWASVLGL